MKHDDGFTLVELLLSLAIVAFIVPALSSVMVVFFRTAIVSSVRDDRSHDDNLLAAYLQPDLASTRTAPTVGGACSEVLTLTWTEQLYVPNGTGVTHSYVATYKGLAASGNDGPFALTRSLTTDGGPTETEVLSHNLSSSCSVAFAVNGSTVSASVVQPDRSGLAEPSVLQVSGLYGGRT